MSEGGEGKVRRSACSVSREPVPQLKNCSVCGEECEVWSDEDEASCIRCGAVLRIDRTMN